MSEQLNTISLRKAATVSGISIIIMTIAAIFATDLTIGSLVTDNPEVTFNNIKFSEMIFRAGVFSWLVILVCDILAAWGLYIFLKPVHKDLSLIMAWFRLIYAAILATALFNYYEVLLLVNNESYITIFSNAQLHLLVMQAINQFKSTWGMGLIVFGIHIYFLGYLIVKSGYLPKWLGILLLLAFIGYVTSNVLDVLVIGYDQLKTIIDWIFILPMLSEVYLGFWLLIKGTKVNPPS